MTNYAQIALVATMRESVLRAVPPYQEVTFAEIAEAVRFDFGSLTDRTIHRYLTRMCDDRIIVRVGPSNHYLYARCRTPRVQARAWQAVVAGKASSAPNAERGPPIMTTS